MSDAPPEKLIEEYLAAFEQRDLARCMDFFADDATINFALGVYKGKKAIDEWHRSRFASGLRVVRVDSIRTEGDAVVVAGLVTSKVAQAWRFSSVAGTMTFLLHNGKFRQGVFRMTTPIPLEGW